MANFVFNIAKGRVAYYADLADAGTGSIVVVPIQSTGIEADSAMKDRATLAAVVANSSEQTTAGRKTVTDIDVTTDNTNDRVDADCADVTWAALASGGAIGKLVFCYKPAGTPTDSQIIPLTAHDFAVTPDGTDVVAQVAVFYRAS